MLFLLCVVLACVPLCMWAYQAYGVPHPTLAWDPSTPPDILTVLSRHEDWTVRRDVAENPSTPPDVLATLAQDNYRVQRAVSQNPSTPPATLLFMSKDVSWIRKFVSRNPSTPYGIWIRTYGRVMP